MPILSMGFGKRVLRKMVVKGFVHCGSDSLLLGFNFLLDQNNSLLFFIRELGSKSSRSKCFFRDIMAKKGHKQKKFPVFSLLNRELRAENGSQRTGSSTIQSVS